MAIIIPGNITFDVSLPWHDIITPGRSYIFCSPQKSRTMGNLLYVIAVILIIIWAIGFFGFHSGGIIHVLLIIAVIALLLKIIRNA
jgi:hypothetical protein